MNQKLLDLAVQRGRLIERSSIQRQRLQEDLQPIGRALRTADQTVVKVNKGIAYLGRHPGIVLTAVAVVVVMRPRRVWRWTKRGFFAWSTWRRLRTHLSEHGLTKRS